MVCRCFQYFSQRVKVLSCLILTTFFCGYCQGTYVSKRGVVMEGMQHPPELFSVVTELEEMAVDPAYLSKKLAIASKPLALYTLHKAVHGRLSLFLETLKNIQVVERGGQYAPSPFQRIVEARPAQEKKLKASHGKRKLHKVQTRKSEVKLLPAAQFEEKGVSISNDGQWIVIAWKSHRIVSIHSLARPGESYGVDYSSAFGTPVDYIARVEMAPDNKAMTMVLGLDKGHCLAVVDFENATVQIPRSVRGLSTHSDSGKFSPDGKLITAHIPRTGDLQVIDWRNHKVVFHTHTTGSQFHSAVFEDNDTILFTSENNVHRVDLKSHKHKRHYFPEQNKTLGDNLRHAEVSSGGRWIVASKYFATRVYSRQTGGQQMEFEFGGPPEIVTSMDDEIIYIAEGGDVVGYSLDTGELIAEYVFDNDGINVLKISPDGRTLIVGYRDGVIRLWDINTGQVSLQLERKDGKAMANVWLTPDHKHLVSSAYSGGEIEVWRLHVNESKLSAMASSLKSMAINSCIDGDADAEEEVLDKLLHLHLGRVIELSVEAETLY
ncbi:WD40 repeat domain-containing protein [Sansalvadorimonas sp. 2012CJ34-2]|uniref:WD40 repeat domain-containing protein n=1 Tax=Parendozoicomonas callyspongiae TaxID=2942213 RepID=A0ABT0PHT1_9GAMM|nr:WD40 repeat domain-containing protein [Sansalvadorimonas sp. 2012CJ34-2]MCL6270947.1 WD40 repeat domain-containing protein [Sansalvadorimonas sp. 2012CJ34-2]